MQASILVQPLMPAVLSGRYDCYLAALGYERRCRQVSEFHRPQANALVASAFPDRKQFSYSENREWFLAAGYRVEEVVDENFPDWFLGILNNSRRIGASCYRLAIDISSLTRLRIATILDVLRGLGWGIVVEVDFIYNLAEFSPPPKNISPNVHVGPVCSSFAGWSKEPEQPPIAVLGLGYEESRALGALEHIQAGDYWVFKPQSDIGEYNRAMLEANSTLLESTPADRLFTYTVESPFDCFATLELLLSRLRSVGSPTLFPFGPKIFSLCGMLVACLYEEVAVWRVSGGVLEQAANRFPTESFCGLKVLFSGGT
jgi:hypothetical protein